jgi:type VI secretion system protein ImpK
LTIAQNWDDLGRREPEFLNDFRAFCQLLTECRKQAESFNVREALPEAANEEAQAIHTRLSQALEAQGRSASREGGPYGYELYREVQYVEAVLADETFLSFDWAGREYWTKHILETQFFGTHNAGDAFFTRLELMLSDRNAGPEGLELLYFAALSLGFEGKYRDRSDQAVLSRYKRELYRRYYFRNATGVQGIQYAFPDCYEHTLDSFVPRKLPSPARWVFGFIAAVVTWIVITQITWIHLTQDLRQSLNGINQSNVSGSTGVAGGK